MNHRRQEENAMNVYVQGEKQAPPSMSSSRGPTRKRPSPSTNRRPSPAPPLHAPLFPSFHPDRASWPERDLAPLELTDVQSRFIAGTVSDIREREREDQRRRRTALSSASLALSSSGGSFPSEETSTAKRQKVEAGHHPFGAADGAPSDIDASGRAVVRSACRPHKQRHFRTLRGGGGRSFVEYVDSYPEVPQFVATSGSMITHGSQSFLETIASSSSPSDPHLPLTVFDLVRTECLGSLYGMLALALHGLGIVEEEAEEDEEIIERSKSSSFSEPVISSAAATTHVDPSILLPRVASMVVSGSEDESDGKEYSRPSVPADRRDDDEDGGEEEEMSLTANSRARGDPSHLCITLPCKMPLGQDVTVIYMDDLPSRCFVGILTPSNLESTSDLPRGQMVRMSDGELCSRVFGGMVCFGAL